MRSVFAVLTLLLALTTPVFAQQAAKATLTGTITDPNGDRVPGGSVTATETGAGISRKSVSKDDGLYALTELAPGEYEVRMELKGVATRHSTNVALQVGLTVALRAPLEVAAITGKSA